MHLFLSKKTEYVLLGALFLVGVLLRAYALPRDMFFGYDQGRDAFVMQEFLSGDFTLIGPTTGLEGVYLGPFYYYLLFPFYLLGGGNPLVAGYGFVLMHGVLVVAIYAFGKKISGPMTGLVASLLFAFSQTNIHFSRWVANPTPLPLFALIAFWLLWLAFERRVVALFLLAGAFFGLCFQLEAANAMWFLPTVAVLVLIEAWRENHLVSKRLISFFRTGIEISMGFVLVSLPQIVFEFKHNFLTTRNLIAAFQTTHDVTLLESLPKRLPWLFELYSHAIFPTHPWMLWIVLLVVGVSITIRRRHFFSSRAWRIILAWFGVPLIFHILYTGNHGNFWDYYVIGQYPAFFLLIAWAVARGMHNVPRSLSAGVLGSLLLLIGAVSSNLWMWKGVFTPPPNQYSIEQQIKASRWIIASSAGEEFGVWIYTPSYQDEANRYILWWVGRDQAVVARTNVESAPLIYLFVEDDGQFWKRRLEWISEKQAFGTVLEEKRFGALTVYKMRNTFLQQNK